MYVAIYRESYAGRVSRCIDSCRAAIAMSVRSTNVYEERGEFMPCFSMADCTQPSVYTTNRMPSLAPTMSRLSPAAAPRYSGESVLL
jgi:hypothetical protein